jgi:geranylgeranylglycerol-phosphate geranylgeranyltransferase
MKLSSFWRLVRGEHAIMLAFAVLVGMLVAANASGAQLPAAEIVFLALLVPVFVEFGAFALNDWADVEADRKNKRADRPIVAGEVSKEFALIVGIIFLIAGVGAGYFIGGAAFWIAFAFAVLSVAYDLFLKDLPLLGNAFIGLSMAISFSFGSIVASGDIVAPVAYISIAALIVGVGREIAKSIQDMEGDKEARKSSTLPIAIGEANAAIVAALCYFAFVPFAIMPFFAGLKPNMLSLGLVVVSFLAFVVMGAEFLKKHDEKFLEGARKTSLYALALGIFAYLLAALI